MTKRPLDVGSNTDGVGLRYNAGKLRYDLFEPAAMEELAKVFTKGAEKYAARNWEKGMSWSTMNASLERHLQAWKKGEDVDAESGCDHMAHVAWNALALVSYRRMYPQGDDRPHRYLRTPRIGLDIDEVLADWVGHWCKYERSKRINKVDTLCDVEESVTIPEFWNFDRHIHTKFAEVVDNEEFWITIPRKIKPIDLPFEPHCYITSRPISLKAVTERWLDENGFPGVPVYYVGFGKSKVDVAKESRIEIFVDDRYENFVELNKAGICTYLWDAPHNRRYNVGYKRITSLKELM